MSEILWQPLPMIGPKWPVPSWTIGPILVNNTADQYHTWANFPGRGPKPTNDVNE